MEKINIKGRHDDDIVIYHWPAQEREAVLVIAHGASEHIDRYAELAEFLSSNGVDVYGYNHRGHGPEHITYEESVFIAEKNGDKLLVDDLEDVSLYAYQHSYKAPLYILGHSMGSLITRVLLANTRISFNGVILMGTLHPSTTAIKAGKLLSTTNNAIFNSRGVNLRLNALAFGDVVDRISYAIDNIEGYVSDPYSGLPFSNAAIVDLLKLTEAATDANNIGKLQKTNYLLMSGKDDQFSEGTKQLKTLVELMDKNNIVNEYHFYHGMKHEILNEKDNKEVYEDVLHFIKETN